ncbi:uncharacterized protein LOC108202561 [Daucus carota subsp. sativus]|uniref:uncharacterized protein LOC108202561 n=1 Tax=Daucus carota subsp. sativus TaxID=79200 RepID=UPI0007E19F99|nr:PREDICTED: uncharacterized protein LOC108202561 [Daucus carota subsp. sativus]
MKAGIEEAAADEQTQVPPVGGSPGPNESMQMFPVMYPVLIPPLQQAQDQVNRRGGLYAVPTYPFMGPMSAFPPTTLIPFTYNVPTGAPTSEAGQMGGEQGQVRQQEQQQQQPGQQRQVVVRRFQIAFQIDLFLILKLAAVIFLFNQDGSKQRLFLLVFFAALIYLYQTGALAPLVRWLSQGMQRAAAPPQPPRAAGRPDNINGDAALAGGQPGAENENHAENNGQQAVMNDQEPGIGNDGNRWWGIVKEVQMIVFGFITSLLPGFHNID